ncbi:hypothetical protein AB1Y20_009574 [Prymnesium parvum]|uniref:Reticulon-like protein n=1 Tax=Prymnesium parvum TaxID=97485 RepID=A0AB34K2E2_PRYPA
MAALAMLAACAYLPSFHTAARPDAAPVRTSPVYLQGGFGFDDRQMKRFNEMKRADEPLEEELKGLALLGGGAAWLLAASLGCSTWLALLLAFQAFEAAPLLATNQGKLGHRARAAGWATTKRVQAVAREAERRGVTAWCRTRVDELRQWDARTRTSAKLKEGLRRLLDLLRRVGARIRYEAFECGLTPFLQTLPMKLRTWSRRSGLAAYLDKLGAAVQRSWRNAVLRFR